VWRELVDYAMATHVVRQQLACRAIGISVSSYPDQPDARRDEALITALQAAVERYPACGFSKLYKVMSRQGHGWNHKGVYRV
jgi:putative transposase